MKKKLSNIVIILIFVAGLSLLVYPFVANKWNSYRQDRLISNYEKIVSQKSDSIDYDAEMKKANGGWPYSFVATSDNTIISIKYGKKNMSVDYEMYEQ